MTKVQKFRGWKNTIHNVNPQEARIQSAKWLKTQGVTWAETSVEPYPEDESRHHIHIFMACKCQHQEGAMKKAIQKLAKQPKFCLPPPEGEEREWNNWWCRPMDIKDLKKTAQQCDDYLRGKTKNKPLGEISIFVKKPCGRRVRYNLETKKYEEFCFYCQDALCLGCCTGCIVCTQTTGHDEVIRRNLIIAREKANEKSLKENRKKVITPHPDDPFAYPRIEYL